MGADSPAFRSGAREGDVIVAVDDWLITPMDRPQVSEGSDWSIAVIEGSDWSIAVKARSLICKKYGESNEGKRCEYESYLTLSCNISILICKKFRICFTSNLTAYLDESRDFIY